MKKKHLTIVPTAEPVEPLVDESIEKAAQQLHKAVNRLVYAVEHLHMPPRAALTTIMLRAIALGRRMPRLTEATPATPRPELAVRTQGLDAVEKRERLARVKGRQ